MTEGVPDRDGDRRGCCLFCFPFMLSERRRLRFARGLRMIGRWSSVCDPYLQRKLVSRTNAHRGGIIDRGW